MARPWYPFYWGDYAGDTAHLSMMQHGSYLLLMQHYYLKAAPLPANAELLQRVCRCTNDAERSAMQSVLDEFFALDGSVYRHARIDEELGKSKYLSKVRSNSAKQRYAKASANAGANAGATREQLDTQPQPHIKTTTLSGDEPPEPVGNWPPGPTLVPEYFQPPDDIKARLFRAGRPDVDPYNPTLLATFVSHHRGKGTCSDDWNAKFLNWCLRERKGVQHETGRTENGGGHRTRGQRIHEKLQDIARRDIESRAAAGGDGGSDGEVLDAIPAQMG